MQEIIFKIMISEDKIKRIAQDIINDDEWVNDSHSQAEHNGIRNGLERLLNHLEETKPSKGMVPNLVTGEHSDSDIVDVLYSDFPKVFEQILEFLDLQN
tara:strand:+ start:1543 stop:1839 length:297 start_codon:yes stop_codon:yes gene_type:complete